MFFRRSRGSVMMMIRNIVIRKVSGKLLEVSRVIERSDDQGEVCEEQMSNTEDHIRISVA